MGYCPAPVASICLLVHTVEMSAYPPHVVARLIQRLKLNYAGEVMGVLGLLNDKVYQQILAEGIDKDPRLSPERMDGTIHPLDPIRSRALIKGDADFEKEVSARILSPLLTWVDDQVKLLKAVAPQPDKVKYQTPELEFLRHLRNALSHGNRFYLRGKEPTSPANFKTFVIDKPLHGKNMVMFDWIGPGDILDLLDHLAV